MIEIIIAIIQHIVLPILINIINYYIQKWLDKY